jgi:hypothetical protein
MRRFALRDDQWDRIKYILPGRAGDVDVSTKENRLFVRARMGALEPKSYSIAARAWCKPVLIESSGRNTCNFGY